MSTDPNLNSADVPRFDQSRSKFLRKGEVGDWKEYFTEEQNKYIDVKTKFYFDPIGLTFDYE